MTTIPGNKSGYRFFRKLRHSTQIGRVYRETRAYRRHCYIGMRRFSRCFLTRPSESRTKEGFRVWQYNNNIIFITVSETVHTADNGNQLTDKTRCVAHTCCNAHNTHRTLMRRLGHYYYYTCVPPVSVYAIRRE